MQESHTGTSVRAHARTLDILPFFLARSLPRRRREESVLHGCCWGPLMLQIVNGPRDYFKKERERERKRMNKKESACS